MSPYPFSLKQFNCRISFRHTPNRSQKISPRKQMPRGGMKTGKAKSKSIPSNIHHPADVFKAARKK
jgi:hypothetical protein